jgi:uncharacterized protein (TIGR02996 family)
MHPPDFGPTPITKRENLQALAVAASPDGHTLAVVFRANDTYDRHELVVWDTSRKARCRLQGEAPTEVEGAAFSPDGRTLVTAGTRGWDAGVVRFWNTRTWKCRTRTVALRPRYVAWAPDGRLLALADASHGGGDAKIALLDVATGRLLRRFGVIESGISALAFSPDGRALAVAHNPEVSVWSIGGRQRWRQRAHGSGDAALAFSPDGSSLISCGEHTAVVWDARTGTPRRFLKGHTGDLRALAFSPEGALLATASFNAIKVWDAATGDERLALQTDWLVWVGFWPTAGQVTAVDYHLKLSTWDVAELLKVSSTAREPVPPPPRVGRSERVASEAEAFLRAVFDTPEDDTARLAYADWLDEHDQPARAEFIRVQVELARLIEPIKKRTKTQEKRITKLVTRERELFARHSDEWLAGLGAIRSVIDETVFKRGFLTRVRMTGVAVTDDHLRHLAGATDLLELDLDGSRVTDAGLARLKPLRNLRELRLSGTPVTTAALKHLAALPKLVEVYHYDWGHEAIPEFEAFKAERNRRLDGLPQEERRAEALRSIRYLGEVVTEAGRLVGVRFSQTRTTDADLAYLREFPEVEWLHFSETWALTSAGLGHLRGLTALKRLHLVETGVTTLEPLRYLTGLEELWVWSTPTVEPDSAQFLVGLPRLKVLGLFNCQLDDAIMPHLGKLAALEELNLTENEVTDAGLEHLAGSRTLKKLEVDHEQRRKALVRRLLRR